MLLALCAGVSVIGISTAFIIGVAWYSLQFIWLLISK